MGVERTLRSGLHRIDRVVVVGVRPLKGNLAVTDDQHPVYVAVLSAADISVNRSQNGGTEGGRECCPYAADWSPKNGLVNSD